ncbi:mechanosensitive ion channel family protein [Comamonas humi]
MLHLKSLLPVWAEEWRDIIVPGLQIVLIVAIAALLHYLLRKLTRRIAQRYDWPLELEVPVKGVLRWLIVGISFLLVLERVGVSASVLWTAISGFAAVGAVAFFAAWSVLSNFFCALLIFTARPFRLGDHIEVIDTFDKPGARGRVVDINMLYTTIEDGSAEHGGAAFLQVPNTQIFQKTVRRWKHPPAPHTLSPVGEIIQK